MDLLHRHRLIYNKFCVCDNHVLVITKEFEHQLDPLNNEDFRAALATCKALDGMLYFNCGFNSGASIPHKHLQIIPYESLYGGILPFEEAALQHSREIESAHFILPQYSKFQHIVYKLAKGGVDVLQTHTAFTDDLDQEAYFNGQAAALERCYHESLKALGYNYEKEPVHQDYNLVLTRHFLLIVLRETDSVKSIENPKVSISMNSLGFAGTMAVKNQESLEFIKEITPIGLLERLAKPTSSSF